MLSLNDGGEEKKIENEKETFSVSSCYNKDWILLTNEQQKLNTFVCSLCNQIANNAVELHCDEHENEEQAYLVGEECLQMYLKQNNGKCPIRQHDHCEFTKGKIARQQVSDLLVICPRQYDLKKKQSKEGINIGEKEEIENESNCNSTNQCNYKGKIKELKNHLDKSCQLISIQQAISLVKELQLQTVLSFEKLKENSLECKKEIEKLKENDKEKDKQIQQRDKQIDALQHESMKKNEQVIELKKDIQQLKSEIDQIKKQIEFMKINDNEQCKQITKLNVDILFSKKILSICIMQQVCFLFFLYLYNKKKKPINDNNQNNIITEFEQVQKEIKIKNDEINKIEANNEDKKEDNNDNQLSQHSIFKFDLFRSSSKLINTLTGHTGCVYSIDYAAFNDSQLICSGSSDKTVRVWDVDKNKQILLFSGHLDYVHCVKFSQYHYHHHRCNVICSSSRDKTIRFWDVKDNRQFQKFNEHTNCVIGIEFSSFHGGRYLCSGSWDKTICLWDVETFKSLHVFNEHTDNVWCVDISPLQSNNNCKSNNIGVIGGNGYTICSGSSDKTIRMWDIETTKQLIVFNGHESTVSSVKYGSNELGNTLLSGSFDKSMRLWDIRSGQQIQVFNGHVHWIYEDNTIRFWDIRSNKNELYVIKGDKKGDNGISCIKFVSLKKKEKNNENINNDCSVHLCYGSNNGFIRIFVYVHTQNQYKGKLKSILFCVQKVFQSNEIFHTFTKFLPLISFTKFSFILKKNQI
ncbi:WD-40 repeat protein [Reticulomyxa filosa]|uniref:WD-40 repeat protein n=1 Tax=Reticulomyxa filosa TaxID=46433 RepID=X6M5J3_RETFI|nr:WD-40 repeat protein [Reticulomyxa filosa]|eukprot:ETO08742.1 WD-40 repeat protein [Reticulomyxa filosa]